jgi:hypothetical protein
MTYLTYFCDQKIMKTFILIIKIQKVCSKIYIKVYNKIKKYLCKSILLLI